MHAAVGYGPLDMELSGMFSGEIYAYAQLLMLVAA